MLPLFVNLLLFNDSFIFIATGIGLLHKASFSLRKLGPPSAVKILSFSSYLDSHLELAGTVLSLVLLKGTLGTQLVDF